MDAGLFRGEGAAQCARRDTDRWIIQFFLRTEQAMPGPIQL